MNRIRSVLSAVVSEPLANRCRDVRDRIQTSKNHYALQRELDDRPAWRDAAAAVKVLLQPAERILFYPERPVAPYAAYVLSIWLGYSIVKDPKRRFDVAFKRANRTLFDPSVLDQVPIAREKIINAGSVDISKRTVGRVFADVFGYELDVDPLQYEGDMIEKSDTNATHDGREVKGSLAPEEINDGAVYQKVINSMSDRDGYYVDYRVPVYGDQIPLIKLKHRPMARRFDDYEFADVREVDEVFGPEDVDRIKRFVRKMGLDYGELDVLKDTDGRIYIIDVNNTPGQAVKLIPKGTQRIALDRMAAAFERMLQTRKMPKNDGFPAGERA